MRLADGSFAPPTWAEGLADARWESDIDRACGLTESGNEFDPFCDPELLHSAIDALTDDDLRELGMAFHMAAHSRFGELLGQRIFTAAFAAAWRSLKPGAEVPDV